MQTCGFAHPLKLVDGRRGGAYLFCDGWQYIIDRTFDEAP